MDTTLDYENDHLRIVVECDAEAASSGFPAKQWYPISKTDRTEVTALFGRPVIKVSTDEGIYVDEEGTVFLLEEKATTSLSLKRKAVFSNRPKKTIRVQQF